MSSFVLVLGIIQLGWMKNEQESKPMGEIRGQGLFGCADISDDPWYYGISWAFKYLFSIYHSVWEVNISEPPWVTVKEKV